MIFNIILVVFPVSFPTYQPPKQHPLRQCISSNCTYKSALGWSRDWNFAHNIHECYRNLCSKDRINKDLECKQKHETTYAGIWSKQNTAGRTPRVPWYVRVPWYLWATFRVEIRHQDYSTDSFLLHWEQRAIIMVCEVAYVIAFSCVETCPKRVSFIFVQFI